MTKMEYLQFIHCFISACLWLFLMYRYISFGNKYEKLLSEKYPQIATQRRKDPFYCITFKAFPVFFSDASELILNDSQIIEYRKKAIYSLILAFAVLFASSVITMVIDHGV